MHVNIFYWDIQSLLVFCIFALLNKQSDLTIPQTKSKEKMQKQKHPHMINTKNLKQQIA